MNVTGGAPISGEKACCMQEQVAICGFIDIGGFQHEVMRLMLN